MDIIDFYRLEQQRIHNWMRNSISDLTPDEWHYTTEGCANNIAFLVWHCVRTEDNILRFILQGRPTIWVEGNWHERLHLRRRQRTLRTRGDGETVGKLAGDTGHRASLYLAPLHSLWRDCGVEGRAGEKGLADLGLLTPRQPLSTPSQTPETPPAHTTPPSPVPDS